MKALEFEAQLNPDRTLTVPPEVAQQLPQELSIRVILLIPESPSEQAWKRLTTEQFLKGYAESDAIYDKLQSG
jgi:mannose-6-phosphate isomerase-like protein (cupin superfamily)